MAFGAAEVAGLTTFSRPLPGSGGGRFLIPGAKAGLFLRGVPADSRDYQIDTDRGEAGGDTHYELLREMPDDSRDYQIDTDRGEAGGDTHYEVLRGSAGGGFAPHFSFFVPFNLIFAITRYFFVSVFQNVGANAIFAITITFFSYRASKLKNG